MLLLLALLAAAPAPDQAAAQAPAARRPPPPPPPQHQGPRFERCEACHQAEELARPIPVTVPVTGSAAGGPRPRAWVFEHGRHTALPCAVCHPAPAAPPPPPPESPTCATCHAEHDAATGDCQLCHRPDCRSCHQLREPLGPHRDAEAVHRTCAACHTQATLAGLTPTRPFCATCHHAQGERHYPAGECATCHLLAEPEALRRRLLPPPESP